MIKQFNETGELLESFSQGNSDEDLLKDAELFSSGIHRGRNYTTKDLQALADSFKPEEQVPVQLDHSSSVRDTVGFLQEVSVKDGKLLGKLRIIEDFAKEKISKKLMNKLSVSFYTDKEGNPTKLREVSLVAFPQLKGARLFSEQPQLDDRRQALYEKVKEFQLQMKFRELQMKMKATEIKLAKAKQKVAEEKVQLQAFREAREEAEYQSYMANLRGENTTKYTAEQDREYEEYLQDLGLRNKGL